MISYLILFTIFAVNCMADITEGPPDYDKPWVPGWGFNESDHNFWRQKHQDFLKQTKEYKDNIRVVFLGSSKTARWLEKGHKAWDKYFVKLGAFNYGIRGDSTRQILWRIKHKELDGLSPKVMVFMIGGNNFKNTYNRGTDEEIVKACLIIMDKIKEKLAKTQIIFVGHLPRRGDSDKRARHSNILLKDHYETNPDALVHFVNYYDKFINKDRSQNNDLYIRDGIHLNKDGYEKLAKLLEPLIKKYLKKS